jgi:16S rRNA (cytosine967-C5)-methyltransferase
LPQSRVLLDSTIAAVAHVLPLTAPADGLLRDFFRAHPKLGHRDRGFVAETVYALLRRRRFVETVAQRRDARALALMALVKLRGLSARDLASVVTPEETRWLEDARQAPATALPPEVVADFPDWLMTKLRSQMTDDEIVTLSRGMQVPAPLDLRVNTRLAKRSEVLQQLQAAGIDAVATPYSPVGVRLNKKIAINQHELYRSGKVEVQDEGSQLLGYVVAPRRQEMVVDFCAGAGGKTLLLGALMQSQGRLYAFDVSEKRLDGLKPRLKRSGLSNVHPVRIDDENDSKVKRLAGKVDRVLLDVPCSGLGTLRRNPDFKWRQTESDIVELVAKQKAILRSASRLVKTGGTLVYATCSVLVEENEDIVEDFLAQQPAFRQSDVEPVLARQEIALKTGRYLRLLPHIHGTDGFFAAIMERVS